MSNSIDKTAAHGSIQYLNPNGLPKNPAASFVRPPSSELVAS